MKVVVTGADGFVGGWLIRELLAAGHHVVGAVRIGGPPSTLPEPERLRVQWVEFDLLASESVAGLATHGGDAVIHLAAVASGSEARYDPGYAWTVNASGTARLCEAYGRARQEGHSDPLVLIVSTGEVYGDGRGRLLHEDMAPAPRSPYAASKWGAEIAAFEVAGRLGLRVMVARAFPHTGPGQSDKYVLPAIAQRLRTAKRIGAPVIKTGNLEPVRDLLDVRDVARAYRLLVERGHPSTIYNVCSGRGHVLSDLVDRMTDLLGYRIIVELDRALMRANDIAHLVGDPTRLAKGVGFAPTIPLEQTLRELLDAQAD
ncbi:MAG: NAD-dependent epimerase/dehydratase family protein [Gemmatimonadetes bacterium]|nr:NAD-dependent epimerase/dehydratase family protein [Gemmatimonadota bacterium]